MNHNKYTHVLTEAAKVAAMRDKAHQQYVENRRKKLHIAVTQADMLLDGRRNRSTVDHNAIDYELIRDHLSNMTPDQIDELSRKTRIHVDDFKRIADDEDINLSKRQVIFLSRHLDEKILLEAL